ncbi:hypothetical protein TBC1_11810 [Lentimicrobium saccharophilum]|uniref:Uncharacterized protein n=1 Tax=Lentimicrobium saccharophilum TaxID=1678841 RepID=A0A0S7C063_9BACT|nr:hypothetical protein TBC1_11810 [Lentimicrobium saccharophilum]
MNFFLIGRYPATAQKQPRLIKCLIYINIKNISIYDRFNMIL